LVTLSGSLVWPHTRTRHHVGRPRAMLYLILGIITTAFAVVGVAVWAYGISRMVRVLRVGRPVEAARKADFGRRITNTLIETVGHTRMLKWRWIGIAHWSIMVSFPALVFTVAEAHGEVWDPRFHLPIIHDWTIYGLFIEVIAALSLAGIIGLTIYRQLRGP